MEWWRMIRENPTKSIVRGGRSRGNLKGGGQHIKSWMNFSAYDSQQNKTKQKIQVKLPSDGSSWNFFFFFLKEISKCFYSPLTALHLGLTVVLSVTLLCISFWILLYLSPWIRCSLQAMIHLFLLTWQSTLYSAAESRQWRHLITNTEEWLRLMTMYANKANWSN